MTAVTVDDREVRAALERLADAAADPRSALEAIGNKLYEITRSGELAPGAQRAVVEIIQEHLAGLS